MSRNLDKAPRTCVVSGLGMYEGYLLHNGECIKEEADLLNWLKTNHEDAYLNEDNTYFTDEWILADAHQEEIYLWTEWYQDMDEEEPIDSGLSQITEFMYFANNFPTDWIEQVWSGNTSKCNHIKIKWNSLCERNSFGGTPNFFKLFMELDGGNKELLCDWIAHNYDSKMQ